LYIYDALVLEPIIFESSKMFLSKEELQKISNYIATLFPQCAGAYLFGSAVTGTFTNQSDIDIAILSEVELDSEDILRMKGFISATFGRDSDIVDLMRADWVTTSQVVAFGEVLVCHQPLVLGNFEVYALSRYANFNKEREGILLDIADKGTIYGG